MDRSKDRHVRASVSSEEIARAVVSARAAFGLDQQTTADLAGVSVRFLRSVEKGKRSVQYDHLVAVLDVLGLALTLEGVGRD